MAQWRAVRDRIHADVCRQGFDAARGSFVQSYGARALDASLLLNPIGRLPAAGGSARRRPVAAIERELLQDGFVRRYDTGSAVDGLPPARAPSSPAASGWQTTTSCSAAVTRPAPCSSGLLALRNDVGLLAEEYDPQAGRQVGNFPQAFSHVALVSTAGNLTRATKPAEQRSGHQAADD